ncbi:TonB-dependent receptor [Coprobacter tertius]|uniref:TonB-dependent receptor n=1 Tax=Coprobacter tertius TaxID=2944915 RepID=A0ABT1MCX6_9BACT|nr:TonB-dependent receptor [Coprobacter tertius]MCP9610503.1 TonB-dependent receptor [Coprobacter tertius]
MRKIFCICFLLVLSVFAVFGQQRYNIYGRVTDKATRSEVSYVNVVLWGTTQGVMTDSIGNYVIADVPPGIYRLQVSGLGYKTTVTPEFRVSSHNYRLDVEVEEDRYVLKEVSVTASPFRPSAESPISRRVIGLQEIEKSPGANRDISKVVNSFPGVSSTVGNGYRNDLLVRGGGPSENKFFLDGIEIPNINHFSTQGASGGPVGIIDADFIREVDFYTGAFPANRGNALSSVLDFKLIDGDPDRCSVKATLGASEVAVTSNGHIEKKTTYLVSVRQSYLQLLFSLLDMPFLPRYTDAQFKIKTRFSRQHELTILGIGAIDDMRLNKDTDPKDEGKQYILNYLPVIKQNTYTVGAVYKHYAGNHTQTLVLSHNFLQNNNTKYRDNDESTPENLTLRYRSNEGESHFRGENLSVLGPVTVNAGLNLDYATYRNRTFQKAFVNDEPMIHEYRTDLDMVKYGLFGSAAYEGLNGKFTASFGFRIDGNNYSSYMNNPLKQFSPRLSLSYNLVADFYLNGNIGRYYELPAYTTMGYKEDGILVNKQNGLTYIRSDQAVLGGEYRFGQRARLSVEGFYKKYTHAPLSVEDQIPLASKGTDYGASGNEAATSTSVGRAYGVEMMFRWFGGKKFNLLTSYTFFRSQFIRPSTGKYIPSAWDNKHLLTFTGMYKLPKNWDLGLKFRLIGGAPYTPYDEYTSSIVSAWDATSRPYYDYTLYNQGRLKTFTEVDFRLDKTFYFKGVMLGFYIDLQNILNQKYNNQPVLVSTGEKYVDNNGVSRYKMKYIEQKSGTILPTLGITVEF